MKLQNKDNIEKREKRENRDKNKNRDTLMILKQKRDTDTPTAAGLINGSTLPEYRSRRFCILVSTYRSVVSTYRSLHTGGRETGIRVRSTTHFPTKTRPSNELNGVTYKLKDATVTGKTTVQST